MSEREEFLRAVAALGVVVDDPGADMLRAARIVELPAGGVLVREGEPANWLGFLVLGAVRIHCLRDQRDVNLGFEFEGGFVGDYAAYMQRVPARSSQQAIEPSRVLRFPREYLDRLLAEHACWRELSRRVAEAELVRKLSEDVERRTRTPEQRYEHLVASASPLLQRVPLYHLASWLGITPETLSRIRARRARRPRS